MRKTLWAEYHKESLSYKETLNGGKTHTWLAPSLEV